MQSYKQAFICLLMLCVSFSAHSADMNKTLRFAMPVAETSFDPIVVSDHYSNIVIEGILEPMLTYDYLARPTKSVNPGLSPATSPSLACLKFA